MNEAFMVGKNICKTRNFGNLFVARKMTVKYGIETVSYRSSQI